MNSETNNNYRKKVLIYSACFISLFSGVPSQSSAKTKLKNTSISSFTDKSPVVKTVHIRDFGAIGDGKTNNTEAFQKAAAYLKANGGKLIIDAGIYIAGKQKLAGSYGAGYSYSPEPVISITGASKPITIIGRKAIIKAADGLKYGSFNPVTGLKDSLRKQGNVSDYYASAFSMINIINCSSITILGITIDGNSGNMDIGPGFGPEGIQLAALGIGLYGNKEAKVADCYIHHCALDGIIVAWPELKDTDPIYPHIITNVRCEYNGRQGLSWVGGNNLTVINCKFSSTGKALNNSIPVVSKPSAGIDIEIENSIIRNGNFLNCLIYNNAGPGVISIANDTYNIHFSKCTFIGTTNSAAYPESQNFSFDSCTFVGMVQRIFGSPNKEKAVSFKDCSFTMDSTLSPSGKVFGNTWEFYDAKNALFDHCIFNAGRKALPAFNTPEIIFLNCTFFQNSDNDFNAAAIFKGTTKFVMKGKGKLNTEQSKFEGTILYNDQKLLK